MADSIVVCATDTKQARTWRDRLAPWVHRVVRIDHVLRLAAWPLVDVIARGWLAEIYFVSGVLKLTHWDSALYLATHEYPIAWLDPVTTAVLGVAVEVGGAVLLASGLATRYAAIAMAALALTIQFHYRAFDSQLYWTAILFWYGVNGAGPLSLDRVLGRGLGASALPGATWLTRAGAWSQRALGPHYQCALRGWFAATAVALWCGLHQTPVLPVASLDLGMDAGSLLVIASFALGFASRYVAIVLGCAVNAAAMMGATFDYQTLLGLTLAFVAVHGSGSFSLDGVCKRWLARDFPELEGRPAFALAQAPRVVIVGAGFGGLACAQALEHARARVTLIDRANHHLFQPLLYQVATAAISPADIASPVRPLFRAAFNTEVRLGTVTGVDPARRVVLVDGAQLPYDYLVLATGATHGYFGREDWAPHAPGLKRLEDATEIRRRILLAFERAEACEQASERRALLTFLIVGGGPTGVELAGAIAELAHSGMADEFRRCDPGSARIILAQSGDRLLPTFAASLSAVAERSLRSLGVEVRTGARVEHIDADGVVINSERLPARTVLWAAGVMASPAARRPIAPAGSRSMPGSKCPVSGMYSRSAIRPRAMPGRVGPCRAWRRRPNRPGLMSPESFADASKDAPCHRPSFVTAIAAAWRRSAARRRSPISGG